MQQRWNWILLAALALPLAAACGDTSRRSDFEVKSADGSTSIVFATEPFAWELRDRNRARRTASADRGPGFTPLAVATSATVGANQWLDPKLPEGDPLVDSIRWFGAADVLDVATGPESGALTLTIATSDETGAPGPFLHLHAAPSASSVQLTVTPAEDAGALLIVATLATAEDEGYFGHGQHFDRLDGRGLVREMQIQAELESESSTNEVHFPIPLFLSTQLYGFWADDRYSAAFDFAAFRDDAARYVTQAPELRFHLFVDDDPLDLIRTYTHLTERPAPVPFWSLAPVWWRNRSHQDEFLDDARRGREFGLPATLIWIDRPWQAYYQNFLFNSVLYPEPEAMFDELDDLGYLVMLHHSPQVNPPGQASGLPAGSVSDPDGLYATYRNNGWLVQLPSGAPFHFNWGGGNGAFIDWTHPDAVAFTQDLMRRITDLGVVGTKMDWDEYLQPNLGALRLRLLFSDGTTNETMKSWYSVLYHKAIYEGLARGREERPFLLVRHGTSRGQKWGVCVWPGDLDNDFTEHTRGPSEMQEAWNVGGLPAAITAGLSLGMSGYPCYGSDIGGYRNGQPSEEALLRWLAFGTFNGVMQLGGGGRTHMPWSRDTPYTEAALRVAQHFFRLRMSLFPYIYEQFHEAHLSGQPVMRSLWLADPTDPTTRLFERDFLFGPDLHVAPIYVEGASERTFYLPAGEWVDWWTGERRPGGTYTHAAPLDHIPLHIRAGAIIPLMPEEIDTLIPNSNPAVVALQDRPLRRLLIAPATEGASEAHFLDGVHVRVAPAGAGMLDVTVGISAPDPTLDERIRMAPEEVVLELVLDGTAWDFDAWDLRFDGEPLGPAGDITCGGHCRYDAETGRLVVTLPRPEGTLRVAPLSGTLLVF